MDDHDKLANGNDELERALRALRRDAARARMQRIAADLTEATESTGSAGVAPVLSPAERRQPAEAPRPRRAPATPRKRTPWADRALLVVEVLALAGLVAIVVLSLESLRRLQQDLFRAPASRSASRTPSSLSLIATAGPEATVTVAHTPTAGPAPVEAPAATAAVSASATQPDPVLSPTLAATASEPPRVTATAPAATGEAAPAEETAPAATPDSPTGYRVVIPAINVDAPVVEGDDWETLKDGIGHHIGSPWPGQAGNVVLSAHNDIYGAIFRDLRDLEPGDRVYVQTPSGTVTYEVLYSRLVLPTEVSVIAPTQEAILTLITCYPPFMDTHRIVVTAQLVDELRPQ